MTPLEKFTEEDFDNCWTYYKSYFIDVLNGDYSLDDAREDLRGLIGSEYDKRIGKLRTPDNQAKDHDNG